MRSVPHSSTSLPPEILEQILRPSLKQQANEIQSINKYPDDDYHGQTFREDADFLLPCCLVSRDWHQVAAEILYQGRIDIRTPQSLKLLLRTVREGLGAPCPIRHLALRTYPTWYSMKNREQFDSLTARLLPLCTELRYLECTSMAFAASRISAVPQFLSLRGLSVGSRDIDFHDIIPILVHAPHLEKLDATSLNNLPPSSRPPPSNFLRRRRRRTPPSDLPSPSFSLRHLRLCDTVLSYSQIQWLLANSHDLAHVELHGHTGGPLAALADATHGSIRSLDVIDRPLVARDIARFPGLQALRLGHQEIDSELLHSMKVPLEALTVFYSDATFQTLVEAVHDTTCLPWLKNIILLLHKTSDIVHAKRKLLEDPCFSREIEYPLFVPSVNILGLGGAKHGIDMLLRLWSITVLL